MAIGKLLRNEEACCKGLERKDAVIYRSCEVRKEEGEKYLDGRGRPFWMLGEREAAVRG